MMEYPVLRMLPGQWTDWYWLCKTEDPLSRYVPNIEGTAAEWRTLVSSWRSGDDRFSVKRLAFECISRQEVALYSPHNRADHVVISSEAMDELVDQIERYLDENEINTTVP